MLLKVWNIIVCVVYLFGSEIWLVLVLSELFMCEEFGYFMWCVIWWFGCYSENMVLLFMFWVWLVEIVIMLCGLLVLNMLVMVSMCMFIFLILVVGI